MFLSALIHKDLKVGLPGRWIIKFMEQKTLGAATRHSASEELNHFLMKSTYTLLCSPDWSLFFGQVKLILNSQLCYCLGLPGGRVLPGFPFTILHLLVIPHIITIFPAHSPWFHHPNKSNSFSAYKYSLHPLSFTSAPLILKYSSQHHVLKHRQRIL